MHHDPDSTSMLSGFSCSPVSLNSSTYRRTEFRVTELNSALQKRVGYV